MTEAYLPRAERTGALRAAAVSLQAGALLDQLQSTSDDDLRRIAHELDDGARCLRAILRQRARNKAQVVRTQDLAMASQPDAATA